MKYSLNKDLIDWKDPVCGKSVNHRDNDMSTVWKGYVYYFCASACLKDFLKDPDKHTAVEASDDLSTKKKSWLRRKWDIYLSRINRTTGGKPPCCH